ncbi:MAG: DnaJ domain-containing protein, partial [Nitrospirota bacterium]|nr:DnaJ domain-containing protein [Nitrospirota bacterium]
HGNDTIREFAQRRSIDMKYLVDGASFVISKMHFNPENNYYITLGLPQHASPEELGRRWKKFMLLYHPDKQLGNEEWVSERAKKVNEAYTALKDETKRAEYDHRLIEQMLSRKFPSAPSHESGRHRRQAKTFNSRRSAESSAGWNSIRQYIPKLLIAAYILIALIVLSFIYSQNRSSHLEAELAPSPAKTGTSERTEAAAPVASSTAAVEEYASKTVAAVAAEPQKDPVQMPRKPKTPPQETSSLQTIKSWFQPAEKQAQVQAKVKENNTSLPEKRETRPQDNASLPLVPLRPSYAEQPRKEDPPQQHEVQKQPAVQRAEPSGPVKPVQEPRQQIPAEPETGQITKKEVEEFMQRYISAYTRNDLNAFISLFSRSAVENNTLTFNEIRNAYKETFSEKINHYRILNMDIRTDGQTAAVSGVYNINRFISAEDRWVRYSGKIAWKLIRENSQLRIISTNYDK